MGHNGYRTKKIVLLSTKDQVKIDKYIKEFERLKNELA